MSKVNMRNILIFTIYLFFCVHCNAVIIIDRNTRNGSFETGQWDPWQATFLVGNAPSFASDGTYYAELAVIGSRVGINQGGISIDKNVGPVFTFHVDVRNGINPFDRLFVWVSGQTYDGEYVSGAPSNIFEIPAEAANTWVTISGTETFSTGDWQELDVLYFGIQLDKKNWAIGDEELLQGFIDNVVLIQSPEPATIALITLGGMILRKRKL